MTPDITVEPTGPEADSDRGERIRLADLSNVYLDRTLVLVGCGKDKRDPENPTDLHQAVCGPEEQVPGYPSGTTGPAWQARDLYTSSYASVKRQFAEAVTRWAGAEPGTEQGWGILSAEHDIVAPHTPLKPYNTRIDDLGDDPTNPEHRVERPYRRPSGGPVVTEMDNWATHVALSLSRWLAQYKHPDAVGCERLEVNTLLVLASQDYLDPLRDRDVFRFGASRVWGDVNDFRELDVDVRFLFEEIDTPNGMFDQMAWLSEAVDRIDAALPENDAGEQAALGSWTGHDRACVTCGVSETAADLTAYGGDAYCPDHEPIGQCSRCGEWTAESGLGSYPLCEGCQTETGGQKREPVDEAPGHEQDELSVATDGVGE